MVLHGGPESTPIVLTNKRIVPVDVIDLGGIFVKAKKVRKQQPLHSTDKGEIQGKENIDSGSTALMLL